MLDVLCEIDTRKENFFSEVGLQKYTVLSFCLQRTKRKKGYHRSISSFN